MQCNSMQFNAIQNDVVFPCGLRYPITLIQTQLIQIQLIQTQLIQIQRIIL